MPCIYIYYKPDAGECKLLGRSGSHKKSANRRVRNVSALTRWDMRWDKRKLLLSPHRIANLTVTYFVIKYRKWNAIMHGNLSVTSVIGKPMHSVHSPILHISICMYYAPFHSTSATSVASSMSTGCRKCNSQTPSNIVTQWIEQLQFSQTPNRLFVWCCRLVVAQQRDDDHQTMFVFCYFLGMTVRWEAICWYMAGRVEIETSIQDDMRWSVELQLSDYRYIMWVVHHSLWTTKPGDRTLVTEHLLCFSIQLSQSTSLVISSSARSASASVATVRHMRNINL